MTASPFLDGRTAIVTGASSGIGRAVARALGAAGANVVLGARRRHMLEMAATEITEAGPGRALAVPTDVADDAQVERLVSEARGAFGPIDILVNNAGIGAAARVADLDMARLDAVMRVNFRAAVFATKLVLPDLVGRRTGAIVNVGSFSSKRGWPKGTPYVAAKFALRGFSLCLWEEVRSSNVRVISVYPDYVSSDFFFAAGWRLEAADRATTPETVADAILGALRLDTRTTVVEIDLAPTNMTCDAQ